MGLEDAVTDCGLWNPQGRIVLARRFYRPGYLVAFAAWAARNNVRWEQVQVVDANVRGYLEAMGLPVALGADDEYQHERRRAGLNYAPLVSLRCENEVDVANGAMTGCLRRLLEGSVPDSFLRELCHVVGEMHDNIWSHGKATGFSAAQRHAFGRDDATLELAVADSGMGFARAMRAAGLTCETDSQAVEWCIQRGNTTKGEGTVDEWAQAVPPDAIGGSPFGPGVPVRVGRAADANHHQGLGLAQLVDLVSAFRGSLRLWSGTGRLDLDDQRRSGYGPAEEWLGVALRVRFRASAVRLAAEQLAEDLDPTAQRVYESLRRARDEHDQL